MMTRDAWAFVLLLTLVASNPVMKYSFCPLSNRLCEPTNFASDSPFEFGNITSGFYYYEWGENRPLSVSCTFHEPLHWTLTLDRNVHVNSISSYFTPVNGSHLFYFYHIQVKNITPGLIRCESYSNSNLAAEIYFAQRHQDYYFSLWTNQINNFVSSSQKRGEQWIVGCSMSTFDPSFNYSTIRLKKMTHSDMVISKVTSECFNCFPCRKCTEANGGTSCPNNISERLWNDKGRQLGVNKTGNQWQDCIRDSKCAFEIAKKFEKTNCNADNETTCSDFFSAISSYPDSCVDGETSSANFIDIEACMVQNLAKSLDSTETDYDPRLGFRLKTERDIDAVYICSSNTSAVYLSTYDPTTKQIKARLEVTDNNSNGPLKGLSCKVPEKWMEIAIMDLVPCFPLFECELQLQTFQGNAFFRTTNSIVSGEKISMIHPQLFGKIVQNPPSSGAMRCKALSRLQTGYIWDLQYFFTGLDSKLYLSNSAPAEAVMSLEKKQTDLTTLTGIHIEVECTVADFIVFPNLQFVVEYSNGTVRKTERMVGLQWKREATRSVSHTLKESTSNEVLVMSIRCRAPFRNSSEEVEAILLISTVPVKPFETTPLPGSPQNLAIVLTVTSGIILLGSVACAIYGIRKYKKSTELRQLTLDEINEFLNGNADLAPGSSREVNVDSIGFPECLQIPATELKMRTLSIVTQCACQCSFKGMFHGLLDTHEVLGEGEFGRCVSGHFRDQKVAVKTTKASMDVEAFKQFLREVKIMAYLGKHENVIEFLGAVVDQLKDRKCMAVVELSPYGDLLRYLRQNEKENLSNFNLYANLPHGEPLESSQSTKLESNHLSYFCEQIASGMEFVVGKRVIHGDLAARNVLVFPDYVVKITDFGLSRKLYTASNYKKKTTTPLPWRHMAIESLKLMEFSPMTDMWAYGVTAWEIFSSGEVPYPGLVYSHEFVHELEQGRRLQRPKNASEEIYQFMKLTWDRVPSARPSFQDAKIFFRRLSTGRE